MIKLILISLGFILHGTLYAEIDKPAMRALQETASNPIVLPAYQTPIADRAVKYAQQFSYNHSLIELYVDGGIQFDYAGRTYSIKLGFNRGAYDSYVQNYKPLPIFIFSQVKLGGAASYSVWPVMKLYETNSTSFNLIDGNNIRLVIEGGVVKINTNSGTAITSFPYAQSWSTWEQNALRYPMSYKSTSGYFVPQAGVDNDRVFSYGYVVSESYPYFPTTRMPLDFVNLYKYGPGSTGYTYKPTAYSIPLGLVFKLLVGQGNNWTLDDLLPADLQDALADELKTSSGINIPMDKDSGAPAALVPGQIK